MIKLVIPSVEYKETFINAVKDVKKMEGFVSPSVRQFADYDLHELETNFENYIGQSGLDENVIKNIISVEQIKQDTNIIIDNIYDGENITINTETIETSLKNNINTS